MVRMFVDDRAARPARHCGIWFSLKMRIGYSGLTTFVLGHQLRQRLHGIGNLARHVAVNSSQLLLGLAGVLFGELTLMLRLAGSGDPGHLLTMLVFENTAPSDPKRQNAPQ